MAMTTPRQKVRGTSAITEVRQSVFRKLPVDSADGRNSIWCFDLS